MSELVIECVDVLVIGGSKHGRVSRVRRDRWMAGWTTVDVQVWGVSTTPPTWAWHYAGSVEFTQMHYRPWWLITEDYNHGGPRHVGTWRDVWYMRVYSITRPDDDELVCDALRLANERNGWVPPLIRDSDRLGIERRF